MELLLVADTFHPAFSGAAIRFRRYLPGLRRRGVKVTIICGTPTSIKAAMTGVERSWLDEPTGRLLPEEAVDGARLYRVRLPDRQSAWRGYMLRRAAVDFCRTREHSVDVVQFLSLGLSSIPALRALRSLDLATVAVGTMTATPPSGSLTGAMKRAALRAPWNLADRVVVSTGAMKRYFRELGVRRPIEIIGNGVDLERFRPGNGGGRTRIRAELGMGRDDPLLLYVGLVNRRKGVDLLLEAWTRLSPRLPAAHLVVAGPRRDVADPDYREFHGRLEELLHASRTERRVHFVGPVSNVEEYMRAADVLVFPSRREGLPNAVLEAMASGLPVVLTPYIGRNSEIGRAGREYLLASPDADSLAGEVLALLSDPPLRARLREAGRSWVERYADVEESLDAYAHLFRALASARGASRGRWEHVGGSVAEDGVT